MCKGEKFAPILSEGPIMKVRVRERENGANDRE